MKKLLVLATTGLLLSSVCVAQDGGDKGKKKAKKTSMHNCPGKECAKKKG